MKKRLSDKKRAQILALRDGGETIERTAKIAGVSTSSVQRIVTANKVGKARNKIGRQIAREEKGAPSAVDLFLYEIYSVAADKKTKAEAFDAIKSIVESFRK
jgi:hypothetical protein